MKNLTGAREISNSDRYHKNINHCEHLRQILISGVKKPKHFHGCLKGIKFWQAWERSSHRYQILTCLKECQILTDFWGC